MQQITLICDVLPPSLLLAPSPSPLLSLSLRPSPLSLSIEGFLSPVDSQSENTFMKAIKRSSAKGLKLFFNMTTF